MNKKRTILFLKSIIIMIWFCTVSNAFAQTMTLKEIDKNLSEAYSKIFPFYYGNQDSLEFYSSLFSSKMISNIKKYPSTLNYPFQTLKKDCEIVTSKNGLFRIYSWDTWLGGTMHDFKNIVQYKSGDKVYTKIFNDTTTNGEGDYIPYYSDIYSLFVNNKTYYLAIGNGMYSTKDVSQSIKIFTIENNSLNDTVKLIKTKSGITNSIDIIFDFFKVVDHEERPVRLIKYDSEKKIIFIPIVLEDGKLTDKFILYQFTGLYFKKILTQKNIPKK
jgi:hypothetical protein